MRRTLNVYEAAQRNQEQLARRIYRSATPEIPGQMYFYVFGFTPLGKKVYWGPFYYKNEAELELVGLDQGEIFEWDTRDMSEATRRLKAELLKRAREKGDDPDEAIKRVLHKRT